MCADAETAAYWMPETSLSRSRVYYLDGDNDVKSLTTDGSVKWIKNIDAPANSQIMFAVSPDDTRIAIAVITLATAIHPGASFTEHMYVEDLATTANRVDLYSSTTLAEWPIAWHAGSIVVATGTAEIANFDNPYGAAGYVLMDPAGGGVRSTLDCSAGLLVSAGTACVSGGCPATTNCTDATAYRQGWDGAKVSLPLPAGPERHLFTGFSYTQLSPDGSRLAASVVTDPVSGDTRTEVLENGAVIQTTLSGAPDGWIDNGHLVISNADAVFILNVKTGELVPMRSLRTIPSQGVPSFVGMLPEDLG